MATIGIGKTADYSADIQLSISGVTGTFSKATARRDGTRMGGFRVWPAIRSPHGQAKRFGFEVFLLETLD